MSKKIAKRDRKGPRRIYMTDKSPFWQYDFVVGGHRHHGSTGLEDEAEAQAWVDAQHADAVRRHEDACERTGQTGQLRDISWIEALDHYTDNVLYKGDNEAGIEAADAQYERLTDWIGETTSVLSIDNDMMKRMVSWLRAKHRYDDPDKGLLSPRTINMYIARTRTVLRHARFEMSVPLPDEPHWQKHVLKAEKRIRTASGGELVAMEDDADEDLWDQIEFVLETGVRRKAAIETRWDQVDWEIGVIRYTNKGGEPIEVNITERIAEILVAQMGRNDVFVFTYVARYTVTKGTERVVGERYPLLHSYFYRHYKELLEKVGIKNLTVHDLRRSRGSFIYRRTSSLGLVQRVLKHVSIKTTEAIYAHLTTDEIGAAMEAGTAYSDEMKARYRQRMGLPPGRRGPGKVPDSTLITGSTTGEDDETGLLFRRTGLIRQVSLPEPIGTVIKPLPTLEFTPGPDGTYAVQEGSVEKSENQGSTHKTTLNPGRSPDVGAVLNRRLRHVLTRLSSDYPTGLDAPFVPSVEERLSASGYRLLELDDGPTLTMKTIRPIIVARPDGMVMLTPEVARHLSAWAASHTGGVG